MAGPYALSKNKTAFTPPGVGKVRFRLLGSGGKVAWIILLSGFVGILLYIYLHFSETGAFPALQKNIGGFAVSILIQVILGSVLYPFNKLLDRWLPWQNYFASRFLTGYATNLVIALALVISLATAIMEISSPDIFWKGLALNDADLVWKIAILFMTFLFIYNVIYALLYSYQHYAIAQLQNLRHERKQLELQFEALKSQISPHYLFNSLNTISSLLFRDLQSAEQFIRRLAQTYQYILATQNKRYVLLSEELDFVQSYYYLLRIRFQQQLNVEINVPVSIMNSRIPPLTLQMLVENAVKHNRLVKGNKLFIYITAEDNMYLKVINTKTEMLVAVDSFKVGLENIRQRYQYFTDKQIVVKDDEKFMVSLPVIRQWHESSEHKYSA